MCCLYVLTTHVCHFQSMLLTSHTSCARTHQPICVHKASLLADLPSITPLTSVVVKVYSHLLPWRTINYCRLLYSPRHKNRLPSLWWGVGAEGDGWFGEGDCIILPTCSLWQWQEASIWHHLIATTHSKSCACPTVHSKHSFCLCVYNVHCICSTLLVYIYYIYYYI